MKKLFTLSLTLISLSLLFVSNISTAKNKLTKKSTIPSIAKYLVTNEKSLDQSKLISQLKLNYSDNKNITLSRTSIACIASGKCKNYLQKIKSVTLFSSLKSKNLKLESYAKQLSTHFKTRVNIEYAQVKESSMTLYYFLALVFMLNIFLIFIIKKDKPTANQIAPDSAHKDKIDFQEKRIKYLTSQNESLESDLAGLYFLWESSKNRYNELQNTFEMKNKLPESLTKKIFEYELKDASRKNLSKYISKDSLL